MQNAIIQEPQNPATSTVIWLHGLGASGDDFAPIVPIFNLPNTRFIFPHAPTRPVTLNMGIKMRAWYDILGLDRFAKQDETGIKKSHEYICELIANENAKGIPNERIILAGFSQGCAMALYTGTRMLVPLAGVIGLSGYLPLHEALEKEASEAAKQTPIFMAHGEFDPVVSFDFGQMARDLLLSHGFQVDFHAYPIEHSVSDVEIMDIKRFLNSKCP